MQRINLGAPYEDFIKSMIESGYYGTATEVIRDALRDKMEKIETTYFRKSEIQHLLKEGEDDIKAGKTVSYDENYMKRAIEIAKKKTIDNSPIPNHLKP